MSLDDSSLDRGPGDSPQSDDSLDVEVARVLESYLAVVEASRPIRGGCWKTIRTWLTACAPACESCAWPNRLRRT